MEKEIKINETHLVVLRRVDNSNIVTIDYVEIINPIRKELDYLYENSENDRYTLDDLERIVSNNEDFKKMLEPMNFCENLCSPYQGISGSEIDYAFFFQIENKSEEELTKEEIVRLSQQKKKNLIYTFRYRDLPYAIDKTYEKCVNDKDILAYSHRKVGWAMPKYNLVNHISIQFLTNFGYGGSSYFFTKLVYKELDIIPFSDWVIYKKADYYDIIRYSQKHRMTNESWFEAMEYAKKAIDLLNDSEKKFIETYILNECKRMVDGLDGILSNHIFSFKQYDGKYEDYEFKDKRLLIEFRGEKISGALGFIESIIKYKEIIEVQNFVNSIIRLNNEINPILKKELEEIQKELNDNQSHFSSIKEKYERIKKEYEFLLKFKDRLKRLSEKKEKDTNVEEKTNIDDCFLKIHPEFIELRNKYEALYEEYYRLSSLINQLEHFVEKFKNYIHVFDSLMSKI